MSLERGARIAHYEILGLLGRGGMGEVYRATDTKLNRDVALKLLPEQFTTDADRMERFQREARVLASMNHSNIAAIYGLEESMPLRALVMELVAGSTLADRIARGPIPIDEVLLIAKQTAEAIEYAHERGIIHRDLKPANIKLTQEGQVKILDFGLAKAITDEVFYANPHDSPTLTAATEAGVVLGTASYMAPEQAKGRVVDRRADIWAFGVILYELLAGRMMFRADSAPETMALVLMSEPDWSALPADTPRALKQLLQRCLVKDPRSRMRDIGDARIAIEEIIASPKTEEPKPEASPRRSRALPWAVAVAITAITVASMWIALRRTNAPQPVTRLTTELGVDAVLTTGAGASAILSPDGRTLAFTAKPSGQTSQVFVRRLDQLQATPLPGTDGADEAFFSPNGQWLAFFANSKLNKTSLTGGSVITICDAEDPRGGTWLEDDSIVFAPNTRSGLMRVPAAGGKPEVLTKLAEGEISHRWPNALPGGDAILFSASASIGYENANLAVYSLRTKETKVLQHGGYYPQYSRSGHLLYIQQGNLFAVPFDADKLQLNGQPVPVLESVMSVVESGGAQYQIANNGALIYTPGRYTSPGFNLEWLTREGKIQSLRETTARYLNPRFSPDGSRLAFEIAAQQYNIWVYEWARDAMTRLTFDPLQDRRPVWTPDGRRIAFTSQRGNKVSFNLYWVRADGTSEPERLTDSTTNQIPTSWHPSGKFLAYYEARPDTRGDIMILPMEGDESSGWRPGKPTPFLQTPFTEAEPAFSPDGRWIAYLSDESGRGEVYVRPFPGPGGKWQISTAGGVLPTWSKNGKEIFFEALDKKIMVVNYTVEGESFHAGKPQVWSEATIASAGAVRDFDIHPDGQRFVILKSADSQAQKLDKVTFVFNFADELRKIAPVR